MDEYTLLDLCEAADVTPRTVRYYISSGLLPPAANQGPKAVYPAESLHRLRLIKALQKQHLPLAEIRGRLESLTPEERARLLAPATNATSALDYIARALGAAPRPPPEAATPAEAAYAPPRSTWERLALHPDVEVHLRRPLDADTRRKLDRLLDYARTLFSEKP